LKHFENTSVRFFEDGINALNLQCVHRENQLVQIPGSICPQCIDVIRTHSMENNQWGCITCVH